MPCVAWMDLENVEYASVTKMRYNLLSPSPYSSPSLPSASLPSLIFLPLPSTSHIAMQIPTAWNVKPTNKDSIVNWKEKDDDVWIIQDDTAGTAPLFLH